MSKQVTIENARMGGFGLPTGQVVPGHGSIVVEPEIWAASKDHPVVKAMVDDGSLIIDGKGKKKPAGERDENGDREEMAEMRKRFDASFSALQTELQAARAKVEELEKGIGERDAEIGRLKQRGALVALKAEHHGGGKFNVTEGETVHLSGLSKADADAFNAMSDEDKVAYIAKAKG